MRAAPWTPPPVRPAAPPKPDHTDRNQIFCRRWVCGPTNADPRSVEAFRRELDALGASYGVGTNDPSNLLSAYFSGYTSIKYLLTDGSLKPYPTRLDYAYVKPEGNGVRLEPVAAEVLRDWASETLWMHIENQGGAKALQNRFALGRIDAPQSVDLSDHSPMLVTFNLTATV